MKSDPELEVICAIARGYLLGSCSTIGRYPRLGASNSGFMWPLEECFLSMKPTFVVNDVAEAPWRALCA